MNQKFKAAHYPVFAVGEVLLPANRDFSTTSGSLFDFLALV
jgi:hypothetical protein